MCHNGILYWCRHPNHCLKTPNRELNWLKVNSELSKSIAVNDCDIIRISTPLCDVIRASIWTNITQCSIIKALKIFRMCVLIWYENLFSLFTPTCIIIKKFVPIIFTSPLQSDVFLPMSPFYKKINYQFFSYRRF